MRNKVPEIAEKNVFVTNQMSQISIRDPGSC